MYLPPAQNLRECQKLRNQVKVYFKKCNWQIVTCGPVSVFANKILLEPGPGLRGGE